MWRLVSSGSFRADDVIERGSKATPVIAPPRVPRRWVERLALTLLAGACCGQLAAQEQPPAGLDPTKKLTQYVLESWDPEDGLPSSRVVDVEQTSDGYLWLATYDGLVRFDGVRFHRFHGGNTPSFTSNEVYSLKARSDGGLWIGGGDGSIILRNGPAFVRLKDPDPAANNGVFSLHEDRQGRLWVLSELEGILRYSYREGRLETLALPPPLRDVPVPTPVVVRRSFFEDDDGTLWFASQGNGVYLIREDGLRVLSSADGLNNDFVQAVAGDRDGSVWIASSRGLNRVRNGLVEDLTADLGLHGTPITSLLVDRAGSLWVGEQALYRHGERGTEQIEPFDHYADPTFFQDLEGSLWVASVTGPLMRFRGGILTTTSTAEGLSGDPVHSVYEDRSGNLWVGTFRAGLNRIGDDGITHFSQADGLPSDRVWSIQEDSGRKGRIWLGTGGGLVRYENGSFEVFTRADGLSSNWIRVVYEDPDEPGTLWLGTIDAGLNRWRDGIVSRWTTEDGLTGDNIRWLLKDRSGALWIGSENGVNLLRDGELTTVRLPNTRTRCAYEDAEGTLWIGTAGGGLLRFREGRFTSYTSREGLPSNDVWAIQEDETGHLWLGSPEGIVRVAKPSPDPDEAVGAYALEIESFGSRDGLKGGLTAGGFPGSWKGADGRLWFATLKGVVAASPDLATRLPVPAALIESISADDESTPPVGPVVIPPGTRQVGIGYTAPGPARPDHLGFRYRLVGYDKEWVDAGDERSARYTKLHPRGFLFEVLAYDKRDGRSGEIATIDLTVLPLWWQTWWFRAVALAVLLASIWGFVRLRIRTVESRRRTLQDHRDELARLGRLAAMGELTAALGHELNQPLGAIRANAEAAARFLSAEEPDLVELREILGDIVKDDQRATNVIQRVRALVKGRPFQPEPLDIKPLIRDVLSLVRADAERRHLTVELEVGPGLPRVLGDRVQLEQILLNLILNGFDALEDSPTRRLSVGAMAVEGELLQVSVRDSGPGASGQSLDKLFESFFTTKPDGMGMGLAISRTIVEAHGGRIWATENPDRGLTFHFTIPTASG
jgi:signal transduction histidine kinase/ligand-binding sensor domain-containing protein